MDASARFTASGGAGGFRDTRHTARSDMTVGDRVLHHEWTGKLSSTRENRKAAEAALHALVNRVAILEEEEEKTRRMLLKSRQKLARTETFVVENGLTGTVAIPGSPMAGASSTGLTSPSATGRSASRGRAVVDPMATTRPPTGSILAWENSYSFARPSTSPRRKPGINLPPIDRTLGLGDDRLVAVQRTTTMLRETQKEAARAAQALEASALRAEKDLRLMHVHETRAGIYMYAKHLHDHGVHLAEEARQRKAEADREAELRRKSDFDARVAAEEATRLATEARIREIAALEEQLLERLQHAPELRVEALTASPMRGTTTRATAGVFSVDAPSGSASSTLRSVASPLRPLTTTGRSGAGMPPVTSPLQATASATLSGGGGAASVRSPSRGAYSRTRGPPIYAVF